MELLRCLPKNNDRIVYVEKKKTYTQKKLDVKEYKANYYIRNAEKYAERNTKYREKQKAIKAGTYIEPVKPVKEEIVEIRYVDNIKVDFFRG